MKCAMELKATMSHVVRGRAKRNILNEWRMYRRNRQRNRAASRRANQNGTIRMRFFSCLAIWKSTCMAVWSVHSICVFIFYYYFGLRRGAYLYNHFVLFCLFFFFCHFQFYCFACAKSHAIATHSDVLRDNENEVDRKCKTR